MAKIGFTPVVGAAVGKAGASVFQRNRQGTIVRLRTVGTNPQSVRQTVVREQLTNVSRSWAAVLTNEERAEWKTFGLLITRTEPIGGKTYHPAGNNIYSELSMNFLRFNPSGTVPTTPPGSEFVPPAITLTEITFDPDTFVISGTQSGSSGAGVTAEILYQPLASVGRNYSANKWKSAGFSADVATPFTWTATIPANDQNFPAYAIAYRFLEEATGQVGEIHVLGIFIPE